MVLDALPPAVDWRADPAMPPIYAQGPLSSCVLHATGAALQWDAARQGEEDFLPSFLQMYYDTRALEGTLPVDCGCCVRDAFKVIASTGYCHESVWPYDISRFREPPPPQAYADAARHTAIEYLSVPQNEQQIKAALASGFLVVFGFAVYASFESQAVARTGVVPMPSASEHQIGGHSMVLVGYDDSPRLWIPRNSWSAAWGMDGYCTMQYEYLLDPGLASDFWAVRRIS